MAASFVLPDDAKTVYESLASESEAEYHRFLALVQGLPTEPVFSRTLDRLLLGRVEVARRPALQRLLFELSRASRTGASLQLSTEDLVAILSTQVFPEDKDSAQRLAARLTSILEIKSLAVHLRAHELLYQEDRCLTESTIVTDARPIFDDEGKVPLGFIIVNHLNLTFTQDGERRRLSIAIDEVDVEELAKIADRARTKIQSLRSLIPRSASEAEKLSIKK